MRLLHGGFAIGFVLVAATCTEPWEILITSFCAAANAYCFGRAGSEEGVDF